MTMQVRVTNETPDPDDVTLVRVYDVPPENGNILPREDKQARAWLRSGESVSVTLSAQRFMMVDDAATLKAAEA